VPQNNAAILVENLPPVFTRADAHLFGLTDARLRTLMAHGHLERPRHGLFTRPGVARGRDTAYLRSIRAATRQFTAGYAVSHLSAAALHGLPMPLGDWGPVHLTAIEATQCSRRRDGVTIHHCDSTLTSLTTRRGVVLTSVDRTLADCLRHFPPRVSVPLADAALHRGLTKIGSIEAELSTQRRWVGRPRAMSTLRLIDGRRQSWLESYSFVRLDEWGISLPVPQATLLDDQGAFVGRVDGLWAADATVAEVDGKEKYLGADGTEVLYREKAREDDIRDLRLQVVRWGTRDIFDRPQQLQRRIHGRRAVGSLGGFRGSYLLQPPTGLTKSSI